MASWHSCDDVGKSGFSGNRVCVVMTKRGVESWNGDLKYHEGDADGMLL
jgi:hypothetical protein